MNICQLWYTIGSTSTMQRQNRESTKTNTETHHMPQSLVSSLSLMLPANRVSSKHVKCSNANEETFWPNTRQETWTSV